MKISNYLPGILCTFLLLFFYQVLFSQPNNYNSVNVTATRSVETSTDMHRQMGKVDETRTGHSQADVTVSLNSDKMPVTERGDHFNLSITGNKNISEGTPFNGNATISFNQSERDYDGCTSTSTSSGNANGDMSNFRVSFQYNKIKKQGEYQVAFSFINPSGGGNGEKKCPNGDNSGGPATQQDIANIIQLESVFGTFQCSNHDIYKDLKLPPQALEAVEAGENKAGNGGTCSILETKTGFEISYSNSVTSNAMTAGDSGSGWKGSNTITISTHVHISIGGKPISYDAILEPIGLPDGKISGDYEHWIPEGPPIGQKGPNQVSHGNALGFDVYLVDKDKPNERVTGVPFNLECTLTGVSKEPGTCINYPAKNPGTDNDLVFDTAAMREIRGIDYNPLHIKTKDTNGAGMVIVIRSYDYGSYGKLQVKAINPLDGATYDAHLKTKPSTTIAIPKDDNNNDISDAWEVQQGIFDKNYSAIWDGETQNGNNNDGDGYTLYEEYRGVSSQNKFKRMNPTMKNLCITYDDDDVDNAIKAGLKAMQTAAGISILELNKDEVNSDKKVNFNYSDNHTNLQSAIKCVKHNFSNPNKIDSLNGAIGNKVMGLAVASSYAADGTPIMTSPKDCIEYRLNQNRMGDVVNVTKNVAHELGHACGLKHHGDNITGLKFSKVQHQVTSYDSLIVLASDGITRITDPSLYPTDNDDIGSANNSASGNVRCYMTYNEDFEYIYQQVAMSDHSDYIFIFTQFGEHEKMHKPYDPSQNIYCTDTKGTEWNSGNKQFGNCEGGKGNCISQFQIKDKNP